MWSCPALSAGIAARTEADKAAARWQDGRRHRKLFSEAWLAFLRTPFPADIYRKVLTKLHTSLMPHMPNPLLLSDFCTVRSTKWCPPRHRRPTHYDSSFVELNGTPVMW